MRHESERARGEAAAAALGQQPVPHIHATCVPPFEQDLAERLAADLADREGGGGSAAPRAAVGREALARAVPREAEALGDLRIVRSTFDGP
jgi:hypothetical protein